MTSRYEITEWYKIWNTNITPVRHWCGFSKSKQARRWNLGETKFLSPKLVNIKSFPPNWWISSVSFEGCSDSLRVQIANAMSDILPKYLCGWSMLGNVSSFAVVGKKVKIETDVFNPIYPGLFEHIRYRGGPPLSILGFSGVRVPILFGNDLPMNDWPYSKGFRKFGCLEP